MITLTRRPSMELPLDAPEKVMAECLAIKSDLVFLWDEAWFAFALLPPGHPQAHRHGRRRTLGRPSGH